MQKFTAQDKSTHYCSLQYTTSLYSTKLNCSALHSTVLYSTVVQCTLQLYTMLCSSVLYCTVVHNNILFSMYLHMWRASTLRTSFIASRPTFSIPWISGTEAIKYLLWSTVRLRFRKSISGHNFQTIRKLDNNDFQHHREVIYSIKQYIHTKKVSSFLHHVRDFTLIYCPN